MFVNIVYMFIYKCDDDNINEDDYDDVDDSDVYKYIHTIYRLALPNIGPKLLSLSLNNVDIKSLRFDTNLLGTGVLPNLKSITLKNIVTLEKRIYGQFTQQI